MKLSKKEKLLFLIPILVLGLFSILNFSLAKENTICAVYFTGVGCTHCAKADPIVLEQLPGEYPNFIVIEYEIYQQTENAPLLYKYCEVYELPYCIPGGPTPCCGLPLVIFTKSHKNIITGDKLILENIRKTIENLDSNKCPLMDGTNIDFNDLDLISLSGSSKVWYQEKILIKKGAGGNNELLKKLLTEENLNEILKGVEFKKVQPIKVPLSGKYVEFNNAIKVGNWIFQWNGAKLEISAPSPEGKTTSEEELPSQETKLEFTLAKILSLAVVDAINPCALAVLSLMLIAILTYNPTKKRNILLAGLAFVFSVFIMYLIYGLVIIKSFQLIQALTSIRIWLYKILGVGAIILGCFKLKEFFKNKAICKVLGKVNKIVSTVTSPKGAFLVGAFVTIFLLPCTIGPYIICGGILSTMCILKSLPWLLLYNLIFILPMLAMVLIIYFGLSKIEDISSWQAKNIKYLDLVAGLVILGLGIAMILGLV